MIVLKDKLYIMWYLGMVWKDRQACEIDILWLLPIMSNHEPSTNL